MGFFLAESLPNIIAETASSHQEAGKTDQGKQGERSLEEVLNLCELYTVFLISFSFCIIILLRFHMLYYLHFKHF